jgi:hypothetical protein
MKNFNEWLGLHITLSMGSMWCVYAFFIIAVAPLVQPWLGPYCTYISTTVIQLIALPAIMVGQNILNKSTEDRAVKQYNAVMETLDDVRDDHAATAELVTDMHQVMTEETAEDADLAEIKAQLAEIKIMLAQWR